MAICLITSPAQEQEEFDEKTHREIVDVYNSGGEEALTSWMAQNKHRVPTAYILDVAQAGIDEKRKILLDVALLLAQTKGDAKALAHVHSMTGHFNYETGNLQQAIVHFNNTLPYLREIKDYLSQGLTNYSLAVIYYSQNRYTEASTAGNKAIDYFIEAGELKWQADTSYLLANAYFRTDNSTAALKVYKNALQLYEQLNDAPGTAVTCYEMGAILYGTGETQRAVEIYQKGLSHSLAAGYKNGQGLGYAGIGFCHAYTGNFNAALEMFKKAVSLIDPGKSAKPLAEVYYGIAEVYLQKGDMLSAFEMYETVLVQAEKSGSIRLRGDVFRGKGYIYSITGDHERALEMHNQSLQLYEKSGHRDGQMAAYLAQAVVLTDIEEFVEAEEVLENALALAVKLNSPWARGWTFLGRAKIYLLQKKFDKVKEMCKLALPVFKNLNFPQAYSAVYELLGNIYLFRHQWAGALELLNQALKGYESLGDIESIHSVTLKKSAALIALHRIGEGLELFDQNFDYLDNVREQTAFSRMKYTLMEQLNPFYEPLLELLVNLNFHERAFKYAEYLRIRLFSDQMVEGLVKLEKGIDRQHLSERDRLIAELSTLTRAISESTAKKNEEKLEIAKKKYRKVENQYEDLMVKIRLNNPKYASIRYPKPITVPELQGRVLNDGEVLLRYLVANNNVFVFLISKYSFDALKLEITANKLNGIINRYLIAANREDGGKMIRYGKQLYQVLFKPLVSAFPTGGGMIIVPDGQLARIPFESLVIKEDSIGRPFYLIEKHPVKYIQSATALGILRKHYRGQETSDCFIGFGDPLYDEQHAKPSPPDRSHLTRGINQRNYQRAGGLYPRLEASGKEVRAIAGLFRKNGRKALIHLGNSASEENAKSPGLEQFGYIHFACHGVMAEEYQGLVLSKKPNAKEDGYLTRNEIMNCQYNAKLVVLSACQTGRGKMAHAEGVTGLTRAVMYAGTSAVVAGLWNVGDNATRELMVEFYRNMLERSMSKEEALREAKLALIENRTYSSPYYWSAFVLYGE